MTDQWLINGLPISSDWAPTPPPSNGWTSTAPCAPSGSVSEFMEALTVTAPNALSSLSNAPTGAFIELVVNGRAFLPVGSPAPFSVAGTTVTWLSSIYSLNPGDEVAIAYTYLA